MFKLFCEQNFCDLKVNHEIHENLELYDIYVYVTTSAFSGPRKA